MKPQNYLEQRKKRLNTIVRKDYLILQYQRMGTNSSLRKMLKNFRKTDK